MLQVNRRWMRGLLLHSNCDSRFWTGSFIRAGIFVKLDRIGSSQYRSSIIFDVMTLYGVSFT